MHKDRLRELSALLREDAGNATGLKFDLGLWAGPADHDPDMGRYFYDPALLELPEISVLHAMPMYDRGEPKLPPVSCGTTGCALGLAMLSGRFEKYGLKGGVMVGGTGVQLLPICNGEDGFGAGQELFGISEHDSRYLFDPDCYSDVPKGAAGELIVADRIDDFIDGDVEQYYHPDNEDDRDGDDA